MTGREKSDFHGFAVLCNENRIIREVIRNELDEGDTIVPGNSLTGIIDEDSIEKYFHFLTTLRRDHALYDWDINIRSGGKIDPLYFVGGVFDGNMLIVASASKSQADFYYAELLRMNNEQTDMLRETIKEKTDRTYFEQLTELNNELADLQRDLHKKNSQLQRVIKARDRYLGMAAHDFRNPLGGINNVCSILLDEDIGPLNEEQREFVTLIQESASHLLEVVEDMLDFSSIEAGKLDLQYGEVDVLNLLKQSTSFNTPAARKKSITIYLSAPPEGTCILRIDRKKIMQVLDNLISNAIKFSPPGTAITVSMEDGEKVVEVSVRDEGPGIEEEEMKFLFRPFQRPNVSATGGEKSSGLGLAICKKIVEGHGGSISAESTPGEGSVFWFTLPR